MVKKRLGAALCLAAALMMAGCQGGGKTQNPSGAAPGQIGNAGDAQQENSIMGKVTAIDGSKITLELVEMPQRGEGGPGGSSDGKTRPAEGETMPEGENPPERPDGETLPELPEGETMPEGETPPELPEGETMPERQTPPGGGEPGELKTTGEEQVVMVSDNTVYAVDERGESREASAADIEEGTVIRVVMDGDTAVSVTIMRMGQKNQEGGNETEK
ncbi:hypothetical protein AALA00_08590 [Lachnospiraceae bacterium 46-15]